MKNNGLLSEHLKVNAEVLSITSAAGATSRNYDMQGHYQGLAVISVAGNASQTPVTIDIMESSAATAAGTSALGSKSALTVGSSEDTSLPASRGVRAMTLTHGTDATGATGDSIQIGVGGKTRTFVFSTSTALKSPNTTAWTSTKSYYGSTVGSTVNTGAQLTVDSLISAINSTLNFGDAIVCSTPTTNTLLLTLADHATGNLSFSATGATEGICMTDWNLAVAAFNVAQDELDSTANKRYASVKVSTGATALKCGVCIIREPARYQSSTFAGNLSTVNFAT